MTLEQSLHGGNRRQIMERYNINRLVDFSASLNPLGPPPRLMRALQKNLRLIEEYPAEHPRKLEEKLARRHGLPPENIMAGNGSAELIYLAPHLCRKDECLIPSPAFCEYELACAAAGKGTIFHTASAKEDFACPWPQVLAREGRRTGLLFIANPNNPTGRLRPREELNFLLEEANRLDFMLVVDEAFLDFVEGGDELSLLARAAETPNLLVLRSLTKFYAIPGLRLGYAAAAGQTIESLRTRQTPWSVNQLAQVAGETIPQLEDYRRQTRALLAKEKKRLYEALAGHPFFTPFPGAANFFLVRIEKKGLGAGRLQRLLIDKGFLIRDCSNFRGLGGDYFRLAVRTPYENRALLAALRELENEIG